ncbi:MAG: OmpA family protein [Pseudomonadota bacterium]
MRLLLVLAGCCSLVTPLHAAEMPEWSIADICRGEGFEGKCLLLERNARNTVSGGWAVLPESYRANCLGEVRDEYDESYRLLSQCLETQALKGLDKDLPGVRGAAAGDGSIVVADAGGAAEVDPTPESYAVLETESLEALMKQREAWGTGADPKPVAAPLAAGAVSPLPKDTTVVATSDAPAEPIINPIEIAPVAELAPQSQADIDKNLAALLKERESWGTAPWGGEITAQSAYPNLATTDLSALLEQRAEWGKGAEAKEVKAPLAAGAVSPLPKDTTVADARSDVGEPIINPVEIAPVAKLTPQSPAETDKNLAALLKERDSWGTEPSKGYAELATSDLDTLIKQRESWGAGPAAKEVKAPPLAAGAVSPLPKDAAVADAGAAIGEPIINPVEIAPVPKLTRQSQVEIDKNLTALLKERDGWGTEPSKGYAVLATSDLDTLIKQRESWGAGPPAKEVKAPLAAGAVSPLPKTSGGVVVADGPPPIINPTEITPAPVLTKQPAQEVDEKLAALLKERESWGTEPSKIPDAYDYLSTANLDDLLAQRATWGGGAEPKEVLAPLAAGAVSPLVKDVPIVVPTDNAAAVIVNPVEIAPVAQLTSQSQAEIDKNLTALLKERESWGTEPSAPGPSIAATDGPAAYAELTTSSLGDLLAQRSQWGAGPDDGAASSEAASSADTSESYPILSVESLSALIAQRETWGMGKAKPIAAPKLAAGAVTPLPMDGGSPAIASSVGEPIINPVEERPDVILTEQSPKSLNEELTALLKEREGWSRGDAEPEPKTETRVAALGTTASTSVVGCEQELEKVASAGGITFRVNRADLTPSSTATLDQLVSVAKSCGEVTISIEGHTDSSGSASLNQALSESRAQAVAAYLKQAGLPESRLKAIGYGEAKPLVPNTSRANRAKNRRIEFSVN